MVRTLNDRSPSGPERVRQRADARRLEILRAAAKVFRERGFSETGMREIAAEADLSPGNLYHYFKGKHEILFFCQDRSLERMLTALRDAGENGNSIAERLRSVLETHARCVLDEIEGSAAHLEIEVLPDELRKTIIEKRDRYERGVRKLVTNGVRAGEFARCDAKLVTRAMLGAINWSARWFRPEGPRSAAAVAGGLADYLLRGLTDSGGVR
jgi:AcrR family transcriptional regulator